MTKAVLDAIENRRTTNIYDSSRNRKDIPRNDVPTMIIHGDDDRILPADATSRRQARMMKNVKYVEIKGGSHGITWTRAEEINAELVPFLAWDTTTSFTKAIGHSRSRFWRQT